MSPTEFDLRGALRDGEGEGVDPDRIVGLGRARRAQRRTRLLTGAAAVVLVAGLATGGAFLAADSSSSQDGTHGGAALSAPSSAGAAGGTALRPNAADTGASSRRGAVGGTGGSSANAPSRAGRPASCPASYPRLMLPGGGSSQFGAGDPMFAEPPVSLTVCAYGREGSTGRPAVLVLTGDQATRLAESLENASKQPHYLPCPHALDSKQNRLVIEGVAADGTSLAAVVTSVQVPQCSIQATNGTAVRYNWAPPADLQPILLALTPRQDVQNPTDLVPGHVSKTPTR